jgi:hypothetical protein
MLRSRFAVLGLCLLALAGCNTNKVNVCPVAVILADAGQMAVFRQGAAQDLSGEAYRVMMTATRSSCDINKKTGETSSSLTVSFRATRAPSADGAQYSVPYFVAVTRGDQIIEKRILTVRFSFAPGASTATFDESPDDFDLHMENGHFPYEYQLMSGFQMTPAQVDYNKKMGRFTP